MHVAKNGAVSNSLYKCAENTHIRLMYYVIGGYFIRFDNSTALFTAPWISSTDRPFGTLNFKLATVLDAIQL